MMKNKLLLLGLACSGLSAVTAFGQYCESGGPYYEFDTNLQGLELIGETSTVTYVPCAYPNPYDDITEPTGYGLAGFEDQTAQLADLIAGNTYSIDVAWGSCQGNYTYSGAVWIDFNGNEIYENFEVVASYASPNGGGYYSNTFTFTVPENASNGTFRMRAIAQEQGVLPLNPCATFDYGSLTDFSISITGGSDCPVADAFIVDATGSDSLTVSWAQGGSELEWMVEYGAAGFMPGTGTSVISTDLTETFNGLSESTDYDVYVYAICGVGDTSSYIGGTIITDCLPINGLGTCESFESDSPSLGCWRTINANNDNDEWILDYDLQTHSGLASATIYTDGNSGDNDDWLISPNLTLTGNEVLHFYYSVFSEWEPNTFEILVSTTGNNPADFTDVLMAADDFDNWEWEDMTLDLSAYTGDVYIAFHVPPFSQDGWYLFIDDVCIDVCVPPAGTDGDMNVCRDDQTVDLNTVITAGMPNGTWEFPLNQNLIDVSEMDYSSLATGSYDVNYVVPGGCVNDTTVATITIYDAPNSGIGGIINLCANQPYDLLSGLSGTVDVNGTWYNTSGAPMASSYTNSGSLGGVFNFTYVVSNGVCPDETANVSVVVDASCNFLGVEEAELEALTVYPNPTTGKAYISAVAVGDGYTYQVIDFSGRELTAKGGKLSNAGETELDLNDCQAGVYFIRITGAESTKTIRLVVE